MVIANASSLEDPRSHIPHDAFRDINLHAQWAPDVPFGYMVTRAR